MNARARKWWYRWRFYISVPDFILLLLVVAVAPWPVVWLSEALRPSPESNFVLPKWLETLSLGIAANLISALFIGGVAVWILRRREVVAACGKFKAFFYDRAKKEYVEWGEVDVIRTLFNPPLMGPRVRCRLRFKDVDIDGEGMITRDQYLLGYYRETGNVARRRMGSFFLVLAGSGDCYEGRILYQDPESGEKLMSGKVRWERLL